MRVDLLAGLLAVALASPAAAQVGGRVTDARGRPLPAVPVELWRGEERVGARSSDAEGAFRFEGVAGAVRLSVRTLGYAPVEHAVAAPAEGVALRLVPEAVALEGVTATAAPRLRCPNREDPEARALWAALRGRYSHAQDSLALSFYTRKHASTTPRGEVGFAGDAGYAWHGVPGAARRAGFHFTSAYTYGFPLQESLDPAFARWQYRPLQGTHASHFIHPEFGERHRLSILARGRSAVVVGFCPSSFPVKGATLRGTLTIARDTTLVRAEWEFRTPRPSEEAGGEVTFVPRGAHPIPLLPARGLFWRRLVGRDVYFQEHEEFVIHLFLPAATVPERPRDWLSRR